MQIHQLKWKKRVSEAVVEAGLGFTDESIIAMLQCLDRSKCSESFAQFNRNKIVCFLITITDHIPNFSMLPKTARNFIRTQYCCCARFYTTGMDFIDRTPNENISPFNGDMLQTTEQYQFFHNACN